MIGEIKAGSKSLQCTFNLLYSEQKMDEKKSVAKCKGKVKKLTRIENFSISGKELNFTFTLTISKKGKITFSSSSIKPVVITTEPTATPAQSMGKTMNSIDKNHRLMILELNCSLGHTKVCTFDHSEESMKMVRLCPKEITKENSDNEPDEEQICSCLPTLLVEQAIKDEISPLGNHHKRCVYIDYNLVFPTVNGLFEFRKLILVYHLQHCRTYTKYISVRNEGKMED